MSNKEEPVELCVIMPYSEFRSIEQRAKKIITPEVQTSPEESLPAADEERDSDSEGKDESASSHEAMDVPLIPKQKAKAKDIKNTLQNHWKSFGEVGGTAHPHGATGNPGIGTLGVAATGG